MIRRIFKIDLLLFLPAIFLSGFGLLMIYGISFDSDPSIFARQLVYFLMSVFIFFLISSLDFKAISHLWPLWYILVIGILLLTFIVGVETRGSVRWLDFGVFKIQGSEIAKPILLLTLATFFAKYPLEKLRNFLISIFLLVLPLIFVFNQPDLGSALILVVIWISLVFIAGANLLHFAATALIALATAPILWNFLKGYQRERVLSFLNPNIDPLGSNYSVAQALIALGSGELTGRGLGRGTQSQLNFLPEEGTDFIFAATGEELGFIGVFLLIVIFAFLIFRLLKTAQTSKNLEASLFIFGAASILFSQFVINAGMNMGVIPVTGITLPFVSFGGSSIISMFILLGLVESARRSNQGV